MKHNQSFSIYALLIAILVHLILILLLVLLGQLKLKIPPHEESKPVKEERFRLSLKEQPSLKPEAIIPNEIPIPRPTLSIPRGEQLDTPAQPKPIIKPSITQPQPIIKPPSPEPEPIKPIEEPKKAFVRHVAKPVADIERKPQPKGLYDILSKADPNVRETLIESKISGNIQKLYGDKFRELSKGEQKYIIDNMTKMLIIANKVLQRYSNSKIPNSFSGSGEVLLEFYLHPNGEITNLKILQQSEYQIMNDLYLETINLSYSQYPRPEQPTLIRWIGTFDIH